MKAIRTSLLSVAALAAMATLSPVNAQEDLDDILARFDEYVEASNYPKALEELEWARRALAKAHAERISALFPARLGEFDGQAPERQEVLGMTTHTRRYTRADGGSLEVVLTEGGQGNPGLAALGQLSKLLGAQVNAEPVRVDGLTGTLLPDDGNGNAAFTISLNAGATLRISGRDAEAVTQAAREFGVATLDAYLSGANPAVKSQI